MKRKLAAALACRNQGTRLYGKPMQNLDIEKGLSVLEYLIDLVQTLAPVEEIVLGVSEGKDNLCFTDFADRQGISYIIGDEEDVLQRLIQCAEKADATDILRLTTESPFTCFEPIEQAWEDHVREDADATFLDNLPDGSGFELIKVDALKYSHQHGERKHRSELCSLFMRENKDKFRIKYVDLPEKLKRLDIRLTIDYPEDLVLCRAVYQHFKDKAPRIPLGEIIQYLDENPKLKDLVDQFIDEGLKTMYL